MNITNIKKTTFSSASCWFRLIDFDEKLGNIVCVKLNEDLGSKDFYIDLLDKLICD